jgi:hypothetical protein
MDNMVARENELIKLLCDDIGEIEKSADAIRNKVHEHLVNLKKIQYEKLYIFLKDLFQIEGEAIPFNEVFDLSYYDRSNIGSFEHWLTVPGYDHFIKETLLILENAKLNNLDIEFLSRFFIDKSDVDGKITFLCGRNETFDIITNELLELGIYIPKNNYRVKNMWDFKSRYRYRFLFDGRDGRDFAPC